MSQRRPSAPWKRRARRGADNDGAAPASPSAPDAGAADEPAEVVALRGDDGRSFEALLSEALQGPAPERPTTGPTHVAPTGPVDDGPPHGEVARHGDPPSDGDEHRSESGEATASVGKGPLGDPTSDITLPGGRRLTRYPLVRD